MFKNYIKISWRNLVRNRIFSIINITGLAIGLSCFLLIALYVMDELNYDRHFENANRIYRINSDIRFGGDNLHMALTSDMMGQLLKKDYPQVEEFTRIFTFNGEKLIKKGEQYIDEEKLANADSTFFKVFSLPAIEGDTKTALNDAHSVVITASTAIKYFGTTHALGKILVTKGNSNNLYRVTAVIKDIPQNSHFNFDFIFSMKDVSYNWGQLTSHNFYTYLLLSKGTDEKAFEKNMDEYTARYVMPEVNQYLHIRNKEELEKSGNRISYTLMPITKIHLYSDRSYEESPGGNIQYVYIFSVVALFILLLACINFMNLNTAQSANRAKEVGIRKVLGTERGGLIIQFLMESTWMVGISLILAFGIVDYALPIFNRLASKSMSLSSLFSTSVLPLILALPLIVGLMAGGYPAFFLSAFRPIEALKGKLRQQVRPVSLRSILVVFQFATSIILIVGTLVLYSQLNYIQTTNIGFKKDQVLIIDRAYSLNNNLDAFVTGIRNMPGVLSGTLTAYLPVSNSSRRDNTFSKDPDMNAKNGLDMQNWRVDYDYLKTLGIEIIKGRNFSPQFTSDSDAMIINESASKILGYADPTGKKIYAMGAKSQSLAYNIIGEVKNFNFESLHHAIGPLAFQLRSSTRFAVFRLNTKNITGLVAQIQKKWRAFEPELPFTYRFLDDSFDEMYRTEQRTGKIALIFSILAIFIACLGLFGLATFIAEQRTKEIGIRKVLGASFRDIIIILSGNFMKLIAIAFVLGAPLAWYFMNSWLRDFAFRIEIGWWVFAIAGLLVVSIALITVSFQAIKAALSSPVAALRSE